MPRASPRLTREARPLPFVRAEAVVRPTNRTRRSSPPIARPLRDIDSVPTWRARSVAFNGTLTSASPRPVKRTNPATSFCVAHRSPPPQAIPPRTPRATPRARPPARPRAGLPPIGLQPGPATPPSRSDAPESAGAQSVHSTAASASAYAARSRVTRERTCPRRALRVACAAAAGRIPFRLGGSDEFRRSS